MLTWSGSDRDLPSLGRNSRFAANRLRRRSLLSVAEHRVPRARRAQGRVVLFRDDTAGRPCELIRRNSESPHQECPPSKRRGVESMNLLILGATGRTGRALVEQALEQGHIVTAFARDPSKVRTTHPNLRIAKGDILDYGSGEAALRGQDAALCAVGIRVRVGLLIAIVILCQVIARFPGLIGPAGWLVRIGVPLLALLVLYRRTTMLSEGTKNIVRA